MRKFRFHPCGNYRERYEDELGIFSTDYGRFWTLIGIVALFAIVPVVSGSYTLYILNMIGIASIAAIGLNILVGFTGQISLGHGAFLGVGAYAAAILSTTLNLPFLVAVPAAAFVTSLVGMVFGIPSVRLKGLYLTIATLAGQFIIEYLLIHWEDLTRGTMGITLPAASIIGMELTSDRSYFFVIYFFLCTMAWVAVNIMRTKYGRAFIAIRDNDRAAEGMGIPVFRYKLLSFAVSSFFAGLAGGLWAYYMISITSEPFNLLLSVEYIAMVIIGGLGSIAGSIYGAVFITLLNEGLRWVTDVIMNMNMFPEMGLNIAPVREFIFGLAIVFFILFEPKGIAEVWRVIRSSFKLWPFSY
jgi:branched-chain amino acid transport system permease protein